MEPIKITDKVTLRQEALRLSILNSKGENRTTRFIIDEAKDFESYLQGESVLPEYVDTSKMFADVMEKMNERWHQPNPWISADSEMKPAKDNDVLCLCGKEVYVARFDGVGWYSSETVKALDPTHWMPIPPFTEPTL